MLRIALTVSLALGCAAGALGAEGDPRVLRHSDVIAMGATSPEKYREFSITVVEWGGAPGSEEQIESWASWAVRPAHELGIHYAGGAGMVTEFARFMDECPEWEEAICLNIRGERLTVPWLWDHSHHGNPAYWFCTNDERYQRFLRGRVLLAVRAGVDGIHIDDHLGSSATYWQDGCYCDRCAAGFREFLRERVTPERLAEAGVGKLDGFDYVAFVRAWLKENPGRRAHEAPLGREYMTYQFGAVTQVMADLRAAAEEAAGRPLTFSANGAPPSPASIVDYQVLTLFSAEVPHAATWGGEPHLGPEPVLAYKLASALERPLAATGAGHDWAYVKAHQGENLVLAWIAQAYALGHYFMTPHRQWCYTDELGTHWYDGPPEVYGPIYGFVRRNPALFDDMQGVGQVAVLYSTRDYHEGDRGAYEAAVALVEANVPFEALVAGCEWVPARLTAERARGFAKVIAPERLTLDAEQQAVVDALAAEGRLVRWEGEATLRQLPASWVQVSGTETVWALPRVAQDGASAVCHLLNRNWDDQADALREQGPFEVTINAEAFAGRTFQRAVLHAPGAEPVALETTVKGGRMSFEVPSLAMWGVVHLTP